MAATQPDDLMSAVAAARERVVAAVARLRHAEADFVTVRQTATINSDAYTWSNHAAAALNGAASSMEHTARTLKDCAERESVHPGVLDDLGNDMAQLLENMRALFRTMRSAAPQDPSSPVLWMDEAVNALSGDLVGSVLDSHSAVAHIARLVGHGSAWDLHLPRRDSDYSEAELAAVASAGMLGVLLLPALEDSAEDLAKETRATSTHP